MARRQPHPAPDRRGAVRLAALLLLGLFGLGFVLAAPAAAHATVVSSDPADGSRLKTAPTAVTITFDETVGIGGVAYLRVTDQTGKAVDAGTAYHPRGDGAKIADKLRAGLGDGSYTASFRVVSADSHPVAGTIRFVVGNGALVHGSVAAADSLTGTGQTFGLVRWISYAGIALLGGLWLLLTVWPAGPGDHRARRLVWTGWGLAVFGAVFELLLQGPYASGGATWRLFDPTLVDATLHSDYGLVHCVRLVLLGALALLLGRVLRPGAALRGAASVAGVLGLGVLVTFSASGHAASTAPTWVSLPVDVLHLAAMAVWLGGLIMLWGALLRRSSADELTEALPTVSTVAFGAVIVLAVTGTYAAWRGVGTLDAWRTPYALLVIGKIALFVGLLALGNVSRRAAQRRALALAETSAVAPEPVFVGADGGRDLPPPARPEARPAGNDPDEWTGREIETERIRRSVALEAFLGIAVLFLTSLLVALPRGKEALAQSYRAPISATADLGGGRHVTVVADPGVHGPVQFTVSVDNGARATVQATATQRARQIGPLPVALARRGARAFDGSATLPVAGRWRIDVVVSTSALDAVTAELTLSLH